MNRISAMTTWMKRRWSGVVLVIGLWGLGLGGPGALACTVDGTSSSDPMTLRRHLVGPCTMAERVERNVPAEDLLNALGDGKGLDLRDVVVEGDLAFDRLPELSVEAVSARSASAASVLRARGMTHARLVAGSLQIHGAVLRGMWATHLRQGVLVIDGDLVITASHIQKSIDFSHTIVLGRVDVSRTTIDYEGFFVNASMAQDADFSGTAFGTHARFHRAVFQGETRFVGTRFRGLAELLEVQFQRGGDFSDAVFSMGTGFSGAVFHDHAEFARATFEREAYFRHAEFLRSVGWSGTHFQQVADFTHAEFAHSPNFTVSTFQQPPLLADTGVDSLETVTKGSGIRDTAIRVLIVMGVGCCLLWAIQQWRNSQRK